MELTVGTIVADRFRLERPLGQGGMGAVWLCRHLNLDIPCAVKFLHPEGAASSDLRSRFEREAKAAAQLRSANVVQILDHGLWSGLPYIAMELLDGEDLDERLRRRRMLTPRETAVIIGQAARALAKAHAAGLVHRDLKPGNLFLVRDDDREIVKVLDFGVAKQTQIDIAGSQTKTGAIMGTPYYMSPEQARGVKEVDHRTDLWALGVIAYQCLVGQLPFESDGLGDLFMLIMAEPLPVPSQKGNVPPGFDGWWARAMARSPSERFQSAKEMAEALAMALGVSFSPSEALPDVTSLGITHGQGPTTGIQMLTRQPVSVPSVSPLTVSAVATEVAPLPPSTAKQSRSKGFKAAVMIVFTVGLAGTLFFIRGQFGAGGEASGAAGSVEVSTLMGRTNAETGDLAGAASAAAPAAASGSSKPELNTSSVSPDVRAPVKAPVASAKPSSPAASPLVPAKAPAATTKAKGKLPSKKTNTHDDGI